MITNPYEIIWNDVRRKTGINRGFNALLAPEPEIICSSDLAILKGQYDTIRRFQSKCIELFYEAISDDGNELSNYLLMGVPPPLGKEFHLSLPTELRHPPRFFRTDQPIPGTICEIQTPGSGWGEICMLANHFKHLEKIQPEHAEFSTKLVQDFKEITRGKTPVIHHLTDNASNLVSNLYFIQDCREKSSEAKFYGFDTSIRATECNLIRTHLFAGMMMENFGFTRLQEAMDGKLYYDYPPLCIFEQKALLALPFDPMYAHWFDDDIRGVFPFTSIMRPSNCLLPDGTEVPLLRISELPRSKRKFFIKFGGIDPSRNWGSRGVFFAGGSTGQLKALLHEIYEDHYSERGIWLIQDDISAKGNVKMVLDNDTINNCNWYRRLSAFYSPSGYLACLGTYKDTKKVHSQSDTVMNILLENGAAINSS